MAGNSRIQFIGLFIIFLFFNSSILYSQDEDVIKVAKVIRGFDEELGYRVLPLHDHQDIMSTDRMDPILRTKYRIPRSEYIVALLDPVSIILPNKVLEWHTGIVFTNKGIYVRQLETEENRFWYGSYKDFTPQYIKITYDDQHIYVVNTSLKKRYPYKITRDAKIYPSELAALIEDLIFITTGVEK